MEAHKYTYLTPETIQRFENMEMLARGIVEGFITGMHKSPHHGFSIEFAEYREYVPGDPVRHIDWNAYARNDRLVIRQYEQETNLRATIFVDCSRSLNYKSTAAVTKLQFACYSAAALVFLLHRQQDAVGLVSHDGAIGKVFPPRTSAMAVREMLLHLDRLQPGGATDLSSVYHEMAERLPRRSMVILLTDLYDDPEKVAGALRHFRHRRHEVLLLHLMDDSELNFPFRGLIEFRDLETQERMEVEAELVRDAVKENVASFIRDYRKICGDAAIDYHVLNTSESVYNVLAAALAKRMHV